MPSLSVFGAQWGDEGKGKIIDLVARDADYVVRYQGGANAGHTVVVEGEKYVLHLVPSGILHPGRVNVIGTGVAVDPARLLEEIDGLRARGVSVDGGNLRLAANAHVIFEHHRLLDRYSERWRGEGRIGTTGRGIGPCYADKAARVGLRVADVLDPDTLRARLKAALAEKNALLANVHGEATLDLDAATERTIELGERIREFVGDTGQELRQAWGAGKRLLFEGAQGALLDIDLGTYPYVTSSNTGTGGIPCGAGVPPRAVGRVVGIAKAYCTRVGEGPFPTELGDATGERLRERGQEYGATTGRPRRCGWFDAVAARYALQVNGADSWVITNLDVLSTFDELRVGVGYRRGAERFADYPAHLDRLDGLEVDWETLPGWSEEICGVRSFDDLPAAARAYVARLEELVGAPACILSVGPARDEVIEREVPQAS